YARITKTGLMGGSNENASGIFTLYVRTNGIHRTVPIKITSWYSLFMPASRKRGSWAVPMKMPPGIFILYARTNDVH
ncbi:MAG TPA: hypothetical protein PLU94_02855, partial [Methanoregulaceae archaeon]|nr:hypothetical protein [Methanoregulaceae archaeon]